MEQKQIEKWIDQLQGEIDNVKSGSVKKDQIPSVTPDQSGPELSDAAAAYVNKLVATIEPIQAGSGDPSPDNVRPITGTSQLDLSINAQPFSIPLGRTVYDGTLDVTTGELVVDRGYVDLGTLNWELISSGSSLVPYFNAMLDGIKSNGSPDLYAINAICSNYPVVKRSQGYFVDKTLCGDGSATAIAMIQVRDSNYSDAASFKEAMSGVQLVYELATPQRFQLTPHQIKLLAGYNYITSNAAALAISYEKSSPFDGLLARMDSLYDALQIQITGLDERVTALEGNNSTTTAPLAAAENKKTLTKRRTK